MKIKIGMAQLLVEGGEPERNLQRAKNLVIEAALQKCDLVILPETMDFAWTHPSVYKEAEPIPGRFSIFFSELSKEYNIYICVGLSEKSCEKIYNTAILINRVGEIILKYSKINLLEVEHPFYEVGNVLKVVDTEFGKIGINICADNYVGALSIGHTLGRMGAQILLSPSSWTVDYFVTEEMDPYKDKWIKPLSSLASLFDMLVVSTTSVGYIVGGPYEGKKMIGCSLAVNKNGIIKQGQFNEFAGELVVFETDVPKNKLKGTQISDYLSNLGINYLPGEKR